MLTTMYAFGLLLFVCAVQSETCLEPSHLTAQEAKEAVDQHNHARTLAQASNMVKLTWSDDLASRAQDWANLCTWGHSLTTECDGSTAVGQNLFMIVGHHTMPPSFSIPSAVGAWDAEKQFYNLTDRTCKNKENTTKVCGHYTQVVWASSREVGCAINRCPEEHHMSSNGSIVINLNAIVFVCNYSPAGNYGKKQPYTKGAPCTECRTILGQYSGVMCEDNICKQCIPAVDGDACTCPARACKNGGVFDTEQCICSCSPDFYGDLCEKPCACKDYPIYKSACEMCRDSEFKYCTDERYRNFMTHYCPVTCGLCGPRPDSCYEV